MSEPKWVSRTTALIIHGRQIAEHGGDTGISHLGLLDSALAAPRNTYNYGSLNIFELAATYAYHIAKNHSFIDGNKRTGWTVSETFLVMNGYEGFSAREVEAIRMMNALTAGDIDISTFADWLAKHHSSSS